MLTRDPTWSADGVLVAASLEAALDIADGLPGDVMVVGGATVYADALAIADEQILTEVHQSPAGDTLYPAYDEADWVATRRESFDGYDRVVAPSGRRWLTVRARSVTRSPPTRDPSTGATARWESATGRHRRPVATLPAPPYLVPSVTPTTWGVMADRCHTETCTPDGSASRIRSGLDRHYVDGDLVMSHVVAVLSATFPPGEDFFVRSVRNFSDEITDPELKQQVAGFIGQEVTHGREHRELNRRLQEMGYPTHRVARFVKGSLADAEKRVPAKLRLAYTAALEHYTATIAEAPADQAGGPGAARRDRGPVDPALARAGGVRAQGRGVRRLPRRRRHRADADLGLPDHDRRPARPGGGRDPVVDAAHRPVDVQPGPAASAASPACATRRSSSAT